MPRDNKSALIQKIAKQAFITFKDCRSASSGDGSVLTDELNELISLVTSVRAKDLKMMAPQNGASPGAAEPPSPPVTYMHICETEVFSMGVFLLRAGASIPLHDHPGMNGMIKVLYGQISVRCFDKLESGLPASEPGLSPPQTASVWRCVLRSVAEYSEGSGPCLLTPVRDNLHQIDAVDGPAAFLDILAPPYNPDDGRDCHYYKVVHGGTEPGAGAEVDPGENERWLLEIPQPEDFWCGGEPYPGPVVAV